MKKGGTGGKGPWLAAAVCLAAVLAIFHLPAAASDPEIEIDGLLINEMRTRLGNEFYEQFAKKWVGPPGMTDFNILFQEMPDARWGSIVTVSVNGDPVLSRIIPPRSLDVEELVDQTIDKVLAYLINDALGKQGPEDPDMAVEGL